MKKKGEKEMVAMGVGSVSGEESCRITYREPGNTADQSAKVDTDWTFRGPRWNGADVQVEIPFKLEIDKTAEGLAFRIWPIGLREIEEKAQRDLVESIRTRLPETIKLYCGKAA